MFRWLLRLLGFGDETAEVRTSPPTNGADRAAEGAIPERPRPVRPPPARQDQEQGSEWGLKPLRDEDFGFLSQMLSVKASTDLQAFTSHDRGFLSLLMRRVHTNDITIPILPEAAIRIRRLLGNPDVNLSKFVEVFKNDPALSAEVLKVSNSAFYSFEQPTHDLSQAVLRLGFNEVRALVMMMSLRSKILHTGSYGAETSLITSLALATARVSGKLSRELGVGEEEAFTRGLLTHLEFFVILGVAAEFNAGKKGMTVSRPALIEAVARVGHETFRLVAKNWGLENLGYVGDEKGDKDEEGREADVKSTRLLINAISLATLEAWHGLPTPTPVEGVSPDRLEKALEEAAVKKTPPPQGGLAERA